MNHGQHGAVGIHPQVGGDLFPIHRLSVEISNAAAVRREAEITRLLTRDVERSVQETTLEQAVPEIAYHPENTL